ncbi:hypothetical protein Clacol_005227 [Clathrus columnatus]|uniref:Uncharacterized protein n=1 Tax=Clathrus columnatus TaxID=1419009 RepID=A0AAV5ABZ2_9AGAM|nr:hypothetical protein Clacol_005227 [Clathrus columnatus]
MAAIIPAGRYAIQSVMFPGRWNLAHIHPPVANTNFTLRADAPASNVFAPNVVPDGGIVGSPLALSQLQATPVAGGGAGVFQIIAISPPGDPVLAFTAPGNPADQNRTLQTLRNGGHSL